MKKHQWRGFITGMLTMALIFSLASSAFATVAKKEATLNYNDIKITLNGSLITPKDVNGNVVEPFTIGGTTYLPLRAIASALGLNVDWDQATRTAILTTGNTSASTEDIELSDGNYVAGIDFPAGIYTITAVKGGGNVYSDNAYNGGIHAIMGDDSYVEQNGNLYQKEYKNIRLSQGVELHLRGGITVKLTYVRDK